MAGLMQCGLLVLAVVAGLSAKPADTDYQLQSIVQRMCADNTPRYESGSYQYGSGRSQYNSGRRYGSRRSGYESGRSGYESGRSGYESGRSGYESGRSGYESGRSGYESGRRGYESGSQKQSVDGYCNLYVDCGQAQQLQYCPVGKFFNGKSCVNSDRAYCSDDPCRTKENGETYSDSKTCQGFYVCLGRQSHYKECYDGDSYSDSNVCGSDSSCNSQIYPHHYGGCDGYDYVVSPDNPGVFLQLTASGQYVEMPCPYGLVFDPSICVCNYPENYFDQYYQPPTPSKESYH